MRIDKSRLFLIAAVLLLTNSLFAQKTIFEFKEGLSVSLLGKYGRDAEVKDEFLFQYAQNSFMIPKSGDLFGPSDLIDRPEWIELVANEKGWFSHKNLRGGYIVCVYNAKKSMNLILEANGQSEVYVNGEIRGGDVYGYGWIQHPVKVHRGENIFIFKGGRGRVKAKLTEPHASIFLSSRDVLMPDLLKGEAIDRLGAIRIVNCSSEKLEGYSIQTLIQGGESKTTEVPTITPYSTRKVPFLTAWNSNASEANSEIHFILLDPRGKEVFTLSENDLNPSVKDINSKHKETFVSDIDGSVQYYSVVPPIDGYKDSLALFLSLHGASVEAVNQANAYSSKAWGTLVAATNRRPYGFDWEDWGRWDAQEVLKLAKDRYKPDPSKQYLTGHSMGGHGTWQVGVTLPGEWAAIAPSAGWYSFMSYAGKKNDENPDPVRQLIVRSTNPSATLKLSRNYLQYGIYILHGDKDDNVPVSQARFMREHLGKYHPDFAYYERPNAGHWWGNECVDWPLLFDFFKAHEQQSIDQIENLEFVTASPGVSSNSRHIHIIQQIEPLKISSLKYSLNIEDKAMEITSNNVSVLMIDFAEFPDNQPYQILVDGKEFKYTPGQNTKQYYHKSDLDWISGSEISSDQKGPHRNGLFKDAFRNNMLFVYATKGTKEENKWAYEKARYDAETFWYRGNGSIDLVADIEYARDKFEGRNVILYGHSEMNSAWDLVLSDCPISIKRGEMSVGEKEYEGEDLASYFVYPLSGSSKNSVGVIAGTGIEGLKSTTPNRYFVSGSGFPDFMLFSSSMFRDGAEGIFGAGYFDNDWKLEEADYFIRE